MKLTNIILRAIKMLRGKMTVFILTILLAYISSIISTIIGPIMSKRIINAIEYKDTALFFSSVTISILAKVLFAVFLPVYFYFSGWASRKAMLNIQKKLLNHVLRLPIDFFNKRKLGEILSVFSNDLDSLNNVYQFHLYKTGEVFFTGGVGFVMLFVIDIKLAFISLLLGMSSIYINKRYNKKFKLLGDKIAEKRSSTTSIFLDAFTGIKAIKLFNRDNYVIQEVNNALLFEYKTKVNLAYQQSILEGILTIINDFSSFGIILIGAYMVQLGMTNWGNVVAIWTLYWAIEDLFCKFPMCISQLQVSVGGVKRVFEVWDMAKESIDERKYCDFDSYNTNTQLEVYNLAFGYENSRLLFSNLNFVANKGELIIINGANGCGKSSLLKVLMGYYCPIKGTIKIDGLHSRKIDNLRKKISYVSQEPQLVSASIHNNITCGDNNISQACVINACEKVGIHKYITNLNNGYDTVLIDNGDSLSGGQKQRIAIARALVKNTSILLLDEISASLDKENETLIMEVVKKISKDKAVIMISHNEDIDDYADRIITIK
ncbi:ABC transporter ATP-binding protein [Clostridiaceae bacterium M8S5]|nr:ABC transporter ATP-binding protein [Clostridiaceae bacterium M8S5]